MKTSEDSHFFSARLRFVVLTDRDGWLHYADSIVLVRASDFSAALERALAVGKGKETQYFNDEGAVVSWRLKEVLTLDRIRAPELDGAETYYESVDVPESERGGVDARFRPEASRPRETI